MLREGLIIATIAVTGLTACGGDDAEPAAKAPVAKKDAAAATQPPDPDKDPYTITCGDLKNPDAANVYSRRASNTLALEAKITSMSQLQAATAIFFGMTEVCKSKPASYKPAKDAVAGVKSGKFKSDL